MPWMHCGLYCRVLLICPHIHVMVSLTEHFKLECSVWVRSDCDELFGTTTFCHVMLCTLFLTELLCELMMSCTGGEPLTSLLRAGLRTDMMQISLFFILQAARSDDKAPLGRKSACLSHPLGAKTCHLCAFFSFTSGLQNFSACHWLGSSKGKML